MRHPATAADFSDNSIRRSWLTRPLSGAWCAIGWLSATAVFVGLTALLGGPSEGDASQSLYSTWANAHGRFACAFPPTTHHHFTSYAQPGPFVAPLYPLLSGALGAITRIGHAVSFPSSTALGPHCSTSSLAIYHWAVSSGAALPTVRLGYLSWIVLMAGVVSLVRACGRGRCGWEPVALVLLACTPPVFLPLLNYFHPQDLVAMGLGLGAVTCAKRGWWIWAGALIGLALTSQQFAILIAAPLLVVASGKRRTRFVLGTIGGFALVVLPEIVVTSGRVVRAVFLGSGNTPGTGGSWLWDLHLHGALLLVVSRNSADCDVSCVVTVGGAAPRVRHSRSRTSLVTHRHVSVSAACLRTELLRVLLHGARRGARGARRHRRSDSRSTHRVDCPIDLGLQPYSLGVCL